MDDLVTVTLLRHGVTQANLEKRYLGWTDVPLTEVSKRALLQASGSFGKEFDLCVTSDLLRAKQTAEILLPKVEQIETKAFREMNFGEWEMKTYDDLKGNSFYRAWIDTPEKVIPPNGESFIEMKTRVDVGFEQLRQATQRGNKNILLVSHGGVMRHLLTRLTKEKKSFFKWQVPHNKAIQLSWSNEDWRDERKCTLLQEAPLMAKGHG